MVNGKQRAYLRKLANGLEPVFQIGKGGVTDVIVEQLRLALDSRELIKVHILETALLDTKQTCNELAARLDAVPVQAIGSKFVLYRRSDKEKNRKIEIPGK
ncbi:MAG: YhbY family RNA-binding protein [Clostridia bacterium]|nr:YhbY family RNA-binding protein [Clostridia bacterium]